LEVSQFYDENIKRRLQLYFHLCLKRHELLHGLVEVYCKVDAKVKSLILRQAGPLIRIIGMTSPALLNLLRSFPPESETFILGLLHALTEGQAPTPDLVIVVREVYETRNLNPRFLIPIIPGLTKSELVLYLPKLIELPTKIVQTVIFKILNSKPSPLSPSELLITLHTIDTKTVSLKRIIEAIQLCFEEKALVRQDVLAKALQQLVDMSPIPPLFLRTVIQTTEKCKQMLSYVMSILKSLIVKQIWNDKSLWQGFIKCCKVTLPTSVPILLQLPVAQFEEALQVPAMADALLNYCKKNKKQVPKQLLPLIQNIDKCEVKNYGYKDVN
jgi:symplekin